MEPGGYTSALVLRTTLQAFTRLTAVLWSALKNYIAAYKLQTVGYHQWT